MNKNNNLKNLSRVVDLVLDRELSALSEIAAKSESVEADIRQLDDSLLALTHQQTGQENLHVSVHNFAWQDWRRRAKIDLNAKLASIRADKEIQLALTRKAFGRSQAIEKLASKFRAWR